MVAVLIKIVFVDKDEKYLSPLEMKFIEDFGEKVDIEVITEPDYLDRYFAEHRLIDILIINKEFYKYEFDKHEIRHVFIVSDSQADSNMNTSQENVNFIYKYLGIKDTYDMILGTAPEIADRINQDKCEVVAVYSPKGGTGSTVVSFGLAACISKIEKQVLYVSTETMQSFAHLLKNYDGKTCSLKELFEASEENLNKCIDNCTGTDEFLDYILPSGSVMSEENTDIFAYMELLNKIKKSGVYDYIIVDTSSELSQSKMNFLNTNDKVVVLFEPDAMSLYKLKLFSEAADTSKNKEYIYVCNKYDESLIDPELANLKIDRVIDKIDMYDSFMGIQSMIETEQFQKLFFRII